jgi:hypothetical protein
MRVNNLYLLYHRKMVKIQKNTLIVNRDEMDRALFPEGKNTELYRDGYRANSNEVRICDGITLIHAQLLYNLSTDL